MATTYDAKHLTVIVDDVHLTGFSEDMVEFEKDEDNWTTKVGAQGDTVRSRVNNKLGTLTITLLSISPQVALLDSLAKNDKLVKVSVIYNGDPKETITSNSAYIKKPATRTYSNEVEDRVFELQLMDAEIN
ncbi:phage structural protein [Paenibacillus caui]|uniref:phage structural protein n=1 Tax=Paenibacillus caui TaxID=2873927 RepID=UPI001CA87095|nr:phage protein [Paenibacillus caui]